MTLRATEVFSAHTSHLGYMVEQDTQEPADFHMFFSELQTQLPPMTSNVVGQVRQAPPEPQDWQVVGHGEQLIPFR